MMAFSVQIVALVKVVIYIDDPRYKSERIMPARPGGSVFLDGAPAETCGYFHQTQDTKYTTQDTKKRRFGLE
jgi:hypothetical protein